MKRRKLKGKLQKKKKKFGKMDPKRKSKIKGGNLMTAFKDFDNILLKEKSAPPESHSAAKTLIQQRSDGKKMSGIDIFEALVATKNVGEELDDSFQEMPVRKISKKKEKKKQKFAMGSLLNMAKMDSKFYSSLSLLVVSDCYSCFVPGERHQEEKGKGKEEEDEEIEIEIP